MQPDRTGNAGTMPTIEDLCVLSRLDPSKYSGYVALLVPQDWGDEGHLVIQTDAPSPAAAITVLAHAVQDIGTRMQMAQEGNWTES